METSRRDHELCIWWGTADRAGHFCECGTVSVVWGNEKTGNPKHVFSADWMHLATLLWFLVPHGIYIVAVCRTGKSFKWSKDGECLCIKLKLQIFEVNDCSDSTAILGQRFCLMTYHEKFMVERHNAKIILGNSTQSVDVSNEQSKQTGKMRKVLGWSILGEVSFSSLVINSALHWQVAVALSRRTTKKKKTHDNQSVKKIWCLWEIFVINNIMNAQRGVCARPVMIFKSEERNPATGILIISLSAFRFQCDKYLSNVMNRCSCCSRQKQTSTTEREFINRMGMV